MFLFGEGMMHCGESWDKGSTAHDGVEAKESSLGGCICYLIYAKFARSVRNVCTCMVEIPLQRVGISS